MRLEKDGEPLWVCGVALGHEAQAAEVLARIPAAAPTVFLHHTPDLIEEVAGPSVDLYLAGHTHGGQMRLPFYGALVTLSKFGKKYEAGLYRVDATTIYVNRGVGLEGGAAPRVRLLCRPEVAVIDLVPERPQD